MFAYWLYVHLSLRVCLYVVQYKAELLQSSDGLFVSYCIASLLRSHHISQQVHSQNSSLVVLSLVSELSHLIG